MGHITGAKELVDTPIIGPALSHILPQESSNPEAIRAMQDYAAEIKAQKASVKDSGLPGAMKEAADAAKAFATSAKASTPSGATVFAGG